MAQEPEPGQVQVGLVDNRLALKAGDVDIAGMKVGMTAEQLAGPMQKEVGVEPEVWEGKMTANGNDGGDYPHRNATAMLNKAGRAHTSPTNASSKASP